MIRPTLVPIPGLRASLVGCACGSYVLGQAPRRGEWPQRGIEPMPPRPLPGAKLTWGVWVPWSSPLQPQAPRPPVAEGFRSLGWPAQRPAAGVAPPVVWSTHQLGLGGSGLMSAPAVLLASVGRRLLASCLLGTARHDEGLPSRAPTSLPT